MDNTYMSPAGRKKFEEEAAAGGRAIFGDGVMHTEDCPAHPENETGPCACTFDPAFRDVGAWLPTSVLPEYWIRFARARQYGFHWFQIGGIAWAWVPAEELRDRLTARTPDPRRDYDNRDQRTRSEDTVGPLPPLNDPQVQAAINELHAMYREGVGPCIASFSLIARRVLAAANTAPTRDASVSVPGTTGGAHE